MIIFLLSFFESLTYLPEKGVNNLRVCARKPWGSRSRPVLHTVLNMTPGSLGISRTKSLVQPWWAWHCLTLNMMSFSCLSPFQVEHIWWCSFWVHLILVPIQGLGITFLHCPWSSDEVCRLHLSINKGLLRTLDFKSQKSTQTIQCKIA